MFVTLLPAYGRDYKTKEAVVKDWAAGKDFVIACIAHPYDGKPINCDQAALETDNFSIRFNNATQLVKV